MTVNSCVINFKAFRPGNVDMPEGISAGGVNLNTGVGATVDDARFFGNHTEPEFDFPELADTGSNIL